MDSLKVTFVQTDGVERTIENVQPGWSLMEIGARSLFALDRPWPAVVAAVIPLIVNVTLTLRMGWFRPELLGLGSSIGLAAGFAALFLTMHARRTRWMREN